MECSVCYKNIKKSYITCHALCSCCYKKIKSQKCPLCRTIMNTKFINNPSIIEVENNFGSKKQILMKNLKKFVFGKAFKLYLSKTLARDNIRTRDDFIIINYKKYEYNEILDLKSYSYFISQNITFYNWAYTSLADKLIDTHNIYNLTKKDIFYIRNYIAYDEYSTPEKRLLKYLWEKEKYKYDLIM